MSTELNRWQPIETAPKDGTPIIGYCVHEADLYYLDDTGRLTTYGAHAEGLSRVSDGIHILVFGGEVDSNNWESSQENYFIPAWWFLNDGNFETVANPTHWIPLPSPPKN